MHWHGLFLDRENDVLFFLLQLFSLLFSYQGPLLKKRRIIFKAKFATCVSMEITILNVLWDGGVREPYNYLLNVPCYL